MSLSMVSARFASVFKPTRSVFPRVSAKFREFPAHRDKPGFRA